MSKFSLVFPSDVGFMLSTSETFRYGVSVKVFIDPMTFLPTGESMFTPTDIKNLESKNIRPAPSKKKSPQRTFLVGQTIVSYKEMFGVDITEYFLNTKGLDGSSVALDRIYSKGVGTVRTTPIYPVSMVSPIPLRWRKGELSGYRRNVRLCPNTTKRNTDTVTETYPDRFVEELNKIISYADMVRTVGETPSFANVGTDYTILEIRESKKDKLVDEVGAKVFTYTDPDAETIFDDGTDVSDGCEYDDSNDPKDDMEGGGSYGFAFDPEYTGEIRDNFRESGDKDLRYYPTKTPQFLDLDMVPNAILGSNVKKPNPFLFRFWIGYAQLCNTCYDRRGRLAVNEAIADAFGVGRDTVTRNVRYAERCLEANEIIGAKGVQMPDVRRFSKPLPGKGFKCNPKMKNLTLNKPWETVDGMTDYWSWGMGKRAVGDYAKKMGKLISEYSTVEEPTEDDVDTFQE